MAWLLTGDHCVLAACPRVTCSSYWQPSQPEVCLRSAYTASWCQ